MSFSVSILSCILGDKVKMKDSNYDYSISRLLVIFVILIMSVCPTFKRQKLEDSIDLKDLNQ